MSKIVLVESEETKSNLRASGNRVTRIRVMRGLGVTSLFRLLEKYHYAINKPIYCPVKTKKKKLFFQQPSRLKGILLWTTLFFVYAFVALVIENFHM